MGARQQPTAAAGQCRMYDRDQALMHTCCNTVSTVVVADVLYLGYCTINTAVLHYEVY